MKSALYLISMLVLLSACGKKGNLSPPPEENPTIIQPTTVKPAA